MAITLGWFAVANADARVDRLHDELRGAARTLGGEKTPEWAFVATTGSWTAILLSPDGMAFVDEWAAETSRRMHAPALSFWVFEGSWSWRLFDGDGVAAMDGHATEVPTLSGDLDAASRVLGIRRELLVRYATAEGEAQFRAAPGDRFPPWDEWAHVDFARRAGIEYPEVDDDERFFFAESDRPRFKKGTRRKPTFEPGSFAVLDPFGVVEIRQRDDKGTFRFVASTDGTLLHGNPSDPGWRQLVTPAEAADLLVALEARPSQLKERRERRRQTDDALASGSPMALAVALSELLEARRQGVLRDPFEHTQLDALRGRLVRELALVTGRSEEELRAELS